MKGEKYDILHVIMQRKVEGRRRISSRISLREGSLIVYISLRESKKYHVDFQPSEEECIVRGNGLFWQSPFDN